MPRNILQENPWQNPLKFIRQKAPTHVCRGARPTFAEELPHRNWTVYAGTLWKSLLQKKQATMRLWRSTGEKENPRDLEGSES